MVPKTVIVEPIVIVEDDIDDQFLIQKVFERIGVISDLLFFSNGKEALEYLQTTDKKTFLILCDINMPLMNGLELRALINKDDQLRKKSIPFVFLSTAARPSDVTEAFDLTVQGFFVKESTLIEMEEALKVIVTYWSKCKHPSSLKTNWR
jgi:CheY-like chemotaxis protein